MFALSKFLQANLLTSPAGAYPNVAPGNTKGGSITIPLTSGLTGLGLSVLQIKTKIVSCHTADFKPVEQEVTGTLIHPPLVFPVSSLQCPRHRTLFANIRPALKP